jgi:hypothetical protein
MANIKKTIYKEAKKIASKTELDITAEELASLTLFKVLNLPYFENVNDFMRLHYNVFDEVSLGNLALNNVKGYNNETIKSFVVKMNIKEGFDDKVETKNLILKQHDQQSFKIFINIVNSSSQLDEAISKINKLMENDPYFFERIMNITNPSYYDNHNKLIKVINQLIAHSESQTYEKYQFEQKTKIKYYRGRGFSNDVKDFVFDFHSFKTLALKPFNELIENINQRDLDALTGIPAFKVENINSFEKKYPEEYKKSVFKIFKESDDLVKRCKETFNLNHYKTEVAKINKYYERVLKNQTAEQLLDTYATPIQNILQVLSKTYPQLFKDVQDSPYEITRQVHRTAKEKDVFIKKEQPLEIYQDYNTSFSYPVVRGFLYYKNEYNRDSGVYVSAHNGLEDITSGEGYFDDNINFGGYRMDIEHLRINRVYEASRNISLALKQEVIEEFAKLASERNCPLVYDIIERDHDGQTKFNNDMKSAIKNLKEKYPNVIFINDCTFLTVEERLETDMKTELMVKLLTDKVPYKNVVKAIKKLEVFAETEDFKTLSKLDYMDRKNDSIRQNTIDTIIKSVSVSKNKIKPSM